MRARNIKPGFFNNERLADCEPLARLLFIGLWCMADRKGRLQDRPRKMKIEILPCDDCDIDTLLDQLEQQEFVFRYEVVGRRYIQIVNFEKHQRPHHKEQPSTIPAPTSAVMLDASMRQESGADTEPGTDPPLPIPPDSLIPDSLIPESSQSDDARAREPAKAEAGRKASARIALPYDTLPPEWLQWTQAEKGWSAEVISDVWAGFKDYWLGRKGKGARKADWPTAWRNWCHSQRIYKGYHHEHKNTQTNPTGSYRPGKSEGFKRALVASALDGIGVAPGPGGDQNPS